MLRDRLKCEHIITEYLHTLKAFTTAFRFGTSAENAIRRSCWLGRNLENCGNTKGSKYYMPINCNGAVNLRKRILTRYEDTQNKISATTYANVERRDKPPGPELNVEPPVLLRNSKTNL